MPRDAATPASLANLAHQNDSGGPSQYSRLKMKDESYQREKWRTQFCLIFNCAGACVCVGVCLSVDLCPFAQKLKKF